MSHFHKDDLQTYLLDTGLSTAVSLSVSNLTNRLLLPENPYSTLIPSLRLEEIKPNLFASQPEEHKWLENLLSGAGYGVYNAKNTRGSRKTSAVNPSSNVIGISLLPHFDGSVYGLKHMVDVMDSVGLVTVAKCQGDLTKVLYPVGVKLQNSQDYREKVSSDGQTKTEQLTSN